MMEERRPSMWWRASTTMRLAHMPEPDTIAPLPVRRRRRAKVRTSEWLWWWGGGWSGGAAQGFGFVELDKLGLVVLGHAGPGRASALLRRPADRNICARI
jgi:hypothetical protein